MELNKVYLGNAIDIIKTFPDESIDCVVTSPPYYGLRDYGINGQIGLEETPEEYIERLVSLFREIRRCLKKDGTLWINIGDTYNGSKRGNTEIIKHKNVAEQCDFVKKKWAGAKQKDLIGIPWLLAFALRADGWYLRQDIIWHKPNPMPEPANDRCVKSHEYIFLLSKSPVYYFDYEAIQEDAVSVDDKPRIFGAKNQVGTMRGDIGSVYQPRDKRNKRDVWSVNVKPNKEAHFATYPEELIVPCILAGCPEKGVVLDPFMGSGTTGIVARKLNRNFVGCELNPEYYKMATKRIFNNGENLFNQ